MPPTRSTSAAQQHPKKKPSKAIKTVEIGGRVLAVSPVLDTLFYWMAERDRIHARRLAREMPPWTEDKILATYPFTNVFRVFDRTTQYILHNVINRGRRGLKECCFRVMLFRSFNRITTWELLDERLGPLTWAGFDFDDYVEVLQEESDSGTALYGAAYILPAPALGRKRNFENHLLLLQRMMEDGLPETLSRIEHMEEAWKVIHSYPGMGDFLSFQLLLDLNMTPHVNLSEDEWAICGPGSLSGLRKIFGSGVLGIEMEALRYLYDSQSEHWARLGIATPPRLYAGRSGVSLVDLEHSLCECDKYSRVKHPSIKGKRTEMKRTFCASEEPLTMDLPAKWVPKDKDAESLTELEDSDPKYEVSHIVEEALCSDGTMSYLVRWVGYGPQDDLWLDEDALADAGDVLKKWRTAKNKRRRSRTSYGRRR